MKTEVAAALAAGVLLFLAGILVGRRPASGEARELAGAGQTLGTGIDLHEDKIRRLQEALARSQRETQALARKITQLRRTRVYERVAQTVDLEDVQAGEADFDVFSLPALLEARAEIGDEQLDQAVILDQELRRRMVENPEDLAAILALFQSSPDHHLTALLGSFRHPEIEKIATAMTAPGEAKDHRLLALEVLDHLDHLSPENHAQLLESVEYEDDPEILGAAIYALPQGVVEPDLRRKTQELLHGAAAHPEPRVRTQAALVMGMSLVDERDVDTLLQLMVDPAPEVRLTSIAALRNYRGGKGNAVVEALRMRLNDADEEFNVRKQAWKMLSRFPMDKGLYREWKQLKHTIDGFGETQ